MSIFGPPLLSLWRRGKEICGVPSTPIAASLFHDKDKGLIYTLLDSHPGWGTQDLLGGFSIERGVKNTGVTCGLPSC